MPKVSVGHIPFGAAGQDRPARRRWWWWRRSAGVGRAQAAWRPAMPPFRPTPVDKEAQRRWVIREIDELPPGSVDEAHDRVLDKRIDRMARQWIAQVLQEFADYLGALKQLRSRAEGAVRHKQLLQEMHDRRAAEAKAARTAAGDRLRGEDDEAKWHQAEHSDPSLLAGRSGASLFYLVAVVLAGVADFTAFYQVMERVLRNLSNQWLIVLVIGFTAMALTLAHYLGVFLRDRQAGARWHHPVLLPACAVLWAALGLMAFWVRWKVSGDSSGATLPSANGTLTVPQANFQSTLPGAAMFAAFYFATGVAAITGSYLSHNPLHRAFRRTVRAHEASISKQAAGARDVADAEANRNAFNHQETAAQQVRDSTIEELKELADELKGLARTQLIKRLNNLSVADAFLAD
jgi:hypothetical protein